MELIQHPLSALLITAALRVSQGLLYRTGPKATTRLFSGGSKNAATDSLPPLLDASGAEILPESLYERLANKRVALYFAAGWCPMCTSFEPALLQFREAANEADKPVQIIYVPSDRSAADQAKRASTMDMWSVPFGENADSLKLKHKVWSGAESLKLGFGRRSGVPALVVLDRDQGQEMTFVPAESQGVCALGSWPLDDECGIWRAPN